MKRRKYPSIIKNSEIRQYSAFEICEEDLNDENDFSKSNPVILLQVLYSFIKNSLISFKSKTLFDFLCNKLSSRKYLAISVLRI